jgi:hypothetical protein
VHGIIFEEAKLSPIQRGALFLRNGIFSFKINGLSYSQIFCAQSYPQKMCRTRSAPFHAKFGARNGIGLENLAKERSTVQFRLSASRLHDH